MTESPSDAAQPHCQAGRGCDRAPCFQARLDATAGQYRVHKRTDLCSEHLGAAIQAITAWANDQGLHGEVTVLAINLPDFDKATAAWGISSLAFATIPLSPLGPPDGQASSSAAAVSDESQPEVNPPGGAPEAEGDPRNRSAAPQVALVPVSLADFARSARRDWASGGGVKQRYREVRSLAAQPGPSGVCTGPPARPRPQRAVPVEANRQ